MSNSLVEFLKKKRFGETTSRVQRKKKRVIVTCDSSESENEVDNPAEININEHDHSVHDNEEEILEDIVCEAPSSDNLKIGAFILSKFLGGSRKKTVYRYCCIVQDIFEDDLQAVTCLFIFNLEQQVSMSVDCRYVYLFGIVYD